MSDRSTRIPSSQVTHKGVRGFLGTNRIRVRRDRNKESRDTYVDYFRDRGIADDYAQNLADYLLSTSHRSNRGQLQRDVVRYAHSLGIELDLSEIRDLN